jgi:predicted phosphodiesterase
VNKNQQESSYRVDVVREVLKEFPGIASLTAARIALKKHGSLFSSLEAARGVVRYVRGAKGKLMLNDLADKSMVRPTVKSGDPFGDLPKAKSEWDAPWCATVIEGSPKILLLPDTHIPFHDPGALRVALNYGLSRGCDVVLLNGDTWDAFAVSQWEKDPRMRDMPGEVKAVRQFLQILRNGFPRARIIYKVGNHEERWERYLMVKAPEVLGMEEFSMRSILQLDNIGAEFVTDMRPIKAGKLHIIHGHEYKFNISNPVNPARGFYMRAKTHVIGSHLHQTSQHSEKSLDGNVISTWSTGCLASLTPRYRPLNSWNHGFAVVSIDKCGGFDVENKRVMNGKAW